jgi:hypothetical protein
MDPPTAAVATAGMGRMSRIGHGGEPRAKSGLIRAGSRWWNQDRKYFLLAKYLCFQLTTYSSTEIMITDYFLVVFQKIS